jgi:hypothetical protein
LVWRSRKKISQIIKDYLYLPFFLLIILWCRLTGEDQLFSKARLLASFTAAAINLTFIVVLNKVWFWRSQMQQ